MSKDAYGSKASGVQWSNEMLLTTMSSSNNRENSLERELDYEDLTIDAGKRSKERRDKANEEKEREAEAKRQEEIKQAMINAGKRSKEKREK
ncbi:hypothetical protein GGR56DRAFT_679123 [Xylariaceae sp. FL0804]|nr:hypothetical protein GGR56DRAFT_679123 [Xylariaceae sp. FL0804]